MGDNGLLQSKSERFSIRIVKLNKHLRSAHKEYTISNQILRSGTSIGANIAEAFCAESTKDFVHKLLIALKEANETRHWLTILFKSDFITDVEYDSIVPDCEELKRILYYTIKKKRVKS